MTPGEVRDELVAIQASLRKLEGTIEKQKSASAAYYPICHDLTEAWDAIELAIETCDEMAMGVT